jgi:hypothetical protein
MKNGQAAAIDLGKTFYKYRGWQGRTFEVLDILLYYPSGSRLPILLSRWTPSQIVPAGDRGRIAFTADTDDSDSSSPSNLFQHHMLVVTSTAAIPTSRRRSGTSRYMAAQ